MKKLSKIIFLCTIVYFISIEVNNAAPYGKTYINNQMSNVWQWLTSWWDEFTQNETKTETIKKLSKTNLQITGKNQIFYFKFILLFF